MTGQYRNIFVYQRVSSSPGAPSAAPRVRSDPYGGNEVTLVPGRLRGYRQFRVAHDPGGVAPQWSLPTDHLTGLVADDVWPPGETSAVCRREALIASGRYVVDESEPKEHPAGQRVPAQTCSCGFYACHSSTDDQVLAPTVCACPWHTRRPGYGHVVGVVEGSGRIEIGERGWRAERVRIVALHLPDPQHKTYVRANPQIITFSTSAGPVSVVDDYMAVREVCPNWKYQRPQLHRGLLDTYRVPIFGHWSDVVHHFPRTNLDALRAAKTDSSAT